MGYRLLFIVNALVAVIFGLAFLFVPAIALQRFGVDEYASTRLVLQFFGTGLLTIGLMAWFAKDAANEAAQKGMGLALLVGSVAGLIMSIIGMATNGIRTLGWLAIVVYFVFVLGYIFVLFLRPRMKEKEQ